MTTTNANNIGTVKGRHHSFLLFLQGYGPVMLVCFLVAFLALLNPAFVKPGNLLNIGIQLVPIAVVAVGTMFVLMSGAIDLTAGVGVSLGAVVIAWFFKQTGSPWISVAAAALSTLSIGVVNAFLITRMRLNPVITTLVMMTIVEGVVLIVTTLTGSFVDVSSPLFLFISRGAPGGIPFLFYFLGLFYLLGWVVLERTKVGAYTLAIGSNENAARNSGISINLYRSLPFLLSGISMAVGSVVLVSRVLWISPGLGGTPLLLDVIAANIIGGVRVSGGRGRIWGVLVGSLVVAIINNAVNIIKIGPQWYDGFKGLIIIVMIVVNRLLEDVRK